MAVQHTAGMLANLTEGLDELLVRGGGEVRYYSQRASGRGPTLQCSAKEGASCASTELRAASRAEVTPSVVCGTGTKMKGEAI